MWVNFSKNRNFNILCNVAIAFVYLVVKTFQSKLVLDLNIVC